MKLHKGRADLHAGSSSSGGRFLAGKVAPSRDTSRRPRRTTALQALSALSAWLPAGAGQDIAARWLLKRHGFPPGAAVRQARISGARFTLDLADWAQGRAYLTRSWDPDLLAFIARELPARGVFFDVGAHVGLVTFAVGVRRPDVTIHAFEPNASNAKGWRRNAALNPEVDARLERSAVGSFDGEVEIRSAGGESAFHFAQPPGSSSSDPADVERVRQISLDTYAAAHGIDRIDVMKLDVEGFEHHVVLGAQELLSDKRVGCIVAEFNDYHLERVGTTREALISWLEEREYAPEPVPATGLRRRKRAASRPFDLVFRP